MKRLIFLSLILFLISITAESQNCSIIPAPLRFQPLPGTFSFKTSSAIVAPETLGEIAGLFAEGVSDILGSKLKVTTRGEKSGNIILILDKSVANTEGYELKVDPSQIEIKASTRAGIYYGLQTLHQLLITAGNGIISSQSIKDSPRFAWRGIMLDVSRTFMPVNLVKRYIDLFSLYKLNVVHLHLTDDQGWRIEIKHYPLLTEVGSKFDPKYNVIHTS